MTVSPTAEMLSEALEASALTQREIAERAGFNHPNIISMLKTGETKVPLDRIPALSDALSLNKQDFLCLAIEEYHPSVHEVLVDILGLPLSDVETDILAMFRVATQSEELDQHRSFRKVLDGVFELLAISAS